MRKVKTLTLKKEVINKIINDNQMGRLFGGMDLNCKSCTPKPATLANDNDCNTANVDCPNTCGTAYTCNG